MEKKKVCNVCYKQFSRKWNLERHLHDVHGIQDDLRRKARIKYEEEIDMPYHLSNGIEPKRRILNKDNNMNHPPPYNQSYYNNINNNLPNNFSYSYGYYNNTSYPYPYSNINSQYKEEEKRKLTIDGKIKIQKVLKNLENYLEKFFPRVFIFQILSWLRYQCLTKKVMNL